MTVAARNKKTSSPESLTPKEWLIALRSSFNPTARRRALAQLQNNLSHPEVKACLVEEYIEVFNVQGPPKTILQSLAQKIRSSKSEIDLSAVGLLNLGNRKTPTSLIPDSALNSQKIYEMLLSDIDEKLAG